MDAAPLAIASVGDQVYSAIRDRIIQGSLRRGARIHQEEPAGELGVSRTPLREALRRLAAEGLVEMRTSRSFDANREFHIALVQASGNGFLLQFVQRLWVARIGEVIYERQSETPERMCPDAEEHEHILSAIESGDSRRAESLTRRHLAEAMQRSTDLLRR